jgi:hypothetical protein
LIGAGLTAWTWLAAAPLWLDEAKVAINVRDRSFMDLSGALWLGQSAPLGWLFAQRAVLLILGSGEPVLRLLPVLNGLGTIAVAVWIGRRWLDRWSRALLVYFCVAGQWLMVFRVEAKHYSADTFWSLLLPAIAVWAFEEAGSRSEATKRWTVWWLLAAFAQWFANGAVFVTPGCAVVIAILIARRYGVRAAASFAALGTVWLVAFWLHYHYALGASHESVYLRAYWQSALPPEAAGPLATIGWIARQLSPLAHNPGGASLATTFWIAAACGFLFARPRHVGLVFATVPIAALLLSAARIVPLQDRLALWIVPALYGGIALAFDRALAMRWSRAEVFSARGLTTGLLLGLSLLVTLDVTIRGWRRLDGLPTATANQGMNDRAASEWLASRRRDGDAVVTTASGWPGLWWYDRPNVAALPASGRLSDGSTMYEASWEPAGQPCAASAVDVLRAHKRVLVYVGFLDLPRGFYEELLTELATIGKTVEETAPLPFSRLAIVEIRPDGQTQLSPGTTGVSRLGGCITVRPAVLW